VSTHGGQRNIAKQKAVWNVSWLVGGAGAVPVTTAPELLVQVNKTSGSAVDEYRAAAFFNTTLPGWTADAGSLFNVHTLAVYIPLPTAPCTLIARYAASPLTAGMTCAQLDTAWAAGTQTPTATTLTIDRRKWLLFYGLHVDSLANGLMFGLDATSAGKYIYSAGLGSISGGAPMLLCAHYSYSKPSAISGTDPVRPDLTALADYLNGLIPATVEIVDCTIQHSAVNAALPDIDVSDMVQGGGDISLRAKVDPIASWTSSNAPFGTLSVHMPSDLAGSNIADKAQYLHIGGTPITMTTDIVRMDNAAALAEITSIQAIAGHSEQSGAGIDIELVSPAGTDMDGKLCRFWPVATDPAPANELNYDTETAPRVLFDLLLNCCPSTRKANVLMGDWFWLLTRFGGTWGSIDVTEAQCTAESSIRSLFDSVASALCLCVGTDLSGNVQVWHPAAYRPSVRVHTLDPLEEYASGVHLTGLESEQYSAITIPYMVSGVDAEETYGGDQNVALIDNGREYSHPIPVDYCDPSGLEWPRLPTIRDAMARQLRQRLLAPAVKIQFDIGLRGLTWRLGDQLVITSDVHHLTALPFMVTALSASPLAAEVQVEAVHYTGWPGGHSLFQGTAPLGIYRWRRARGWVDSGSPPYNPTLANLSWGADLTADLALGGPGSTWGTQAFGSWEGAAMYIGETGAVNVKGVQSVAVTYAGCAIPTAAGTYPNQADIQFSLMDNAVYFVGNAEYDWLWRWWNTSSGAGLALLLRNPYAPNPCPAGSLRVVLANCKSCNPGIGLWGGANIVASVSTPYGATMPSGAGAGTPGLIRSISVAWDAKNAARLFESQHLVGTLTSTPTPTSMNAFDLRTPLHYSAGIYVLNYLTRLIYNATAPTAATMLPEDGLDPYYP
jgi:hypothetical protein